MLYAIAEELGNTSAHFGDRLKLLPLLESLCNTDETVVRNQAIKSLVSISSALSNENVEEVFAPMVLRLSSMEVLPARLSSIGLITCCYKGAGRQKKSLRKYLCSLKCIGNSLNYARRRYR